MQVSAENPARIGTLGPIPVADAYQDPGQRRRVRAELRHALVILESAEPGHAEGGVNVSEDLPDPAPLPAAAPDVDDLQAGKRLPVLAAELRSDQLVTGADSEDHRAPVGGRGQAAIRPAGTYLPREAPADQSSPAPTPPRCRAAGRGAQGQAGCHDPRRC